MAMQELLLTVVLLACLVLHTRCMPYEVQIGIRIATGAIDTHSSYHLPVGRHFNRTP